MRRRRLFSKENTFWALSGQVLDADGGCKEVVQKLQSYALLKGIKVSLSLTASHCTARKKLNEQVLFHVDDVTVTHVTYIQETS